MFVMSIRGDGGRCIRRSAPADEIVAVTGRFVAGQAVIDADSGFGIDLEGVFRAVVQIVGDSLVAGTVETDVVDEGSIAGGVAGTEDINEHDVVFIRIFRFFQICIFEIALFFC